MIGIGVGINRHRSSGSFSDSYSLRVMNNGGVSESLDCVENVSTLLKTASLLLVPSGYKSGKVYAEIPTNGNGDLTWTRGSDAFRTNASGLIQRVPWNFVQQSQNFADSSWIALNSTKGSTIQTDPSGYNTAVNVTWSSGGSKYFYRSQSGLTIGTTYTLSFYVKSSNASKFRIYADSLNVSSSNLTSTSDFARYTLTFTPTATSGTIGLQAASDNTAADLIVAFAQLVEGTTAQTYLPTTDRLNVPRLDYTYGSCPALLLEPQRTNLVLQSETFDNASWTKTDSSVTANTTTSPDGTTNADSLIENTATALHQISQGTLSTGGIYTATIYAKKNQRNWIFLNIAPASNYGTWFDIDNGVVGTIQSNITNATITNVGNGWYRCSITANTGALFPRLSLTISTANNVTSYTGNGTSGIFIYGAQLEAGAYATTYIPTTTATVTRVADSFSRNNIYTNGLITSSGGTWFASFVNNVEYVKDSGDRGLFLDTSNTGNTNGFQFYHRTGVGNVRILINKRISGADTILFQSAATTIKFAIKWNGTTADVFANGTKVVTATSFTTTAMEFLNFTTDGVPFFIQQMALYSSPLSDTDCISITTL